MRKRLLSTLLALCMALTLIPTITVPAGAAVRDSGKQIAITTVEQLQNISQNLSGEYVLQNNLDLSRVPNFTPIGTKDAPFTGSFDGGGHTISGLTITSSDSGVGLFGYVSNGTIQNLVLVSPTVSTSGKGDVGAVVGNISNGSVIKCVTVGGEISSGDSIGGVIGFASNTKVQYCGNSANVTGSQSVGGIIGNSNQAGGEVSYCLNLGGVTASQKTAGGIVGVTTVASWSNKSASVSNCFNEGSVYAKSVAGGIEGHANYSDIIDCGNIGSVQADQSAGGLVGILISNRECPRFCVTVQSSANRAKI